MDSLYQEIICLVNYLNECTKAYDLGHPLISDKEWDDKYFQLVEMERKTGLILSHSPTQSISFEVVNELQKREHNHKMLSLEKTKSYDDLVDFVGNRLYLVMCKMDGLTCSLTYKNGELVSAETRGNGLVGEDILHNIRVLPSVPKQIPYKEEITIDGEIICTYEDFEEFKDIYKNPRNFAAGSIRLLDANMCASRKLTFVAWDVITPMYANIVSSNKEIDFNLEYRLSHKLAYLESIGFTIVPFFCHKGNLTTKRIMETFVEDVNRQAQQKGYPIDGAVIKFDECEYGRSLGETSHHFKNAIAFKFYDETYPSKLIDIEWTMGRTGVLTPVAVFETIEIDGTEVTRASLHNISVMEELFHGTPFKNQEVEVYKANMIIPQIYSAENVRDMAFYCELPFFDIPKVCPICGSMVKVEQEIDSKTLVCINTLCEGKLINRLDHFVGKKGLDIKGLSKATLSKLADWGWVETFTDIFELSTHKDEWVKKPGFGVKSVEKILNAIEDSKNCELHQFIAALGVPLIGSTASKELTKHFDSWEKFYEAVNCKYEFYNIPNFGVEMYKSIINFNYEEANLLAQHYIHFNSVEVPVIESNVDLTGKVFVVTGKLTHFKNRDEIKSYIESLGGKVTGSVSKNTHYLINNDVNSTSSKNKTAQSLGIPIMSEEDFIQAFGTGN